MSVKECQGNAAFCLGAKVLLSPDIYLAAIVRSIGFGAGYYTTLLSVNGDVYTHTRTAAVEQTKQKLSRSQVKQEDDTY